MKDRNYNKVAGLANVTNDLEVIVKEMGKEYTALKVASMVGTLGRKGVVPKEKATVLLANFPNIAKFLDMEIGAKMVGKISYGTTNTPPEPRRKSTMAPTAPRVVKVPKLTDKEKAVLNTITAAKKTVTADDIANLNTNISIASARIVLANLANKKGMLRMTEAKVGGKATKSYALISE